MSAVSFSLPKTMVWFVTGTSQGFGRELVCLALARGDAVVATSRDPAKVAVAFPDAGDRLLPTGLDLHALASLQAAVEGAVARFGRIDVLGQQRLARHHRSPGGSQRREEATRKRPASLR